MTALIAAALRLRAVVLGLAVLLAGFGIYVARETSYDVFPEFAPPLIEIQTEAPGLSTEEVEALVTIPLENALNGLPGLETIRSKSVLGLSSVVVILQEGSDLLASRQLAQERLATIARTLPSVAAPPVILPPLSSTSRVLKVGLTSETLSQMELTDRARWTILPKLMAVPGVANVAIWGERARQIQVRVDPEELRAHGVTLDSVMLAAQRATALGPGGFLDTPNQRLAIRHLVPVLTPDDLGRAILSTRGGAVLHLSDVAELAYGAAAPIGDAVIDDTTGLLLIVEKQPSANTLDVTHEVERALDVLAPALPGIEIHPRIFRPATFIERSLRNLAQAMALGCILVVAVLVFFLYDWRTALISVSAIPLSLLGAAVALHELGVTIDTMVLAGLVIAVGEVVDDAIIDVENIARRLRLNRELAEPEPPFQVVLAASVEVRSAVVFASLIVVLVFLPVFFLDGVAGALFRPLALAYMLAILASLVVALTVTPALAFTLLTGARGARAEPPLVGRLKARYRAVLPVSLAHPRTVLALAAGAIAATALMLGLLGEEFLPDFKERDFLMHWVEKPGTSLDAMRRITLRVAKELGEVPGLHSFGAHIGRAELGDEVVGPNFTELWVSIEEDVDYDPTVARISEIVSGYPGLHRDVLTYLRERIKEILTGASATVVVRIYGADFVGLQKAAAKVRQAVAGVPGVSDLKVEPQVLVPQVQVRLRPERAALFGLTSADVHRTTAAVVNGTRVGQVYDGEKIVDVSVWGVPDARSDIEALRSLPVDTPAGQPVPLGEVADVAIVPSPNEIKREGASRRIDVLCNVSGRDLGSVAKDIERIVTGVPMEAGDHAEVMGEYAAREASQRRLLLLSGASLLGIFLVLAADFRSLRLTLLVFLTLPFALLGGALAALVTGGVLSLGSLVGFVAVIGIAARNAIMLASHYRHLEHDEGEAFGRRLVVRGAEERLSPILMTALCAALALLPIALRGNVPGHEIEHPMAVVILGGLLTSTVLNLLLLPSLYLAWGRRDGGPPGETRVRS